LRAAGIPFEREKEFQVLYKGIPLRHKFHCEFVVRGEVILEVKAIAGFVDEHYKQLINYLAISKCKLGLLYHFGGPSLMIKRLFVD